MAATVALAFGLAAASFFPAILLGIFDKRMNRQGAISGMVLGMLMMMFYIMRYKLAVFGETTPDQWWFGISPEGFGTVAMAVNMIVALTVSRLTPEPPEEIKNLVENIRHPS